VIVPIARTFCAACDAKSFTVVPNTSDRYADYAEFLLPARTQLEHDDLAQGYGHLYATYNKRVDCPIASNSGTARLSAHRRAMNLDYPELLRVIAGLMRAALTGPPSHERRHAGGVEGDGSVRLTLPSPHVPFRRARAADASGKIEIESSRWQHSDSIRCPATCRVRVGGTDPVLARRFPARASSRRRRTNFSLELRQSRSLRNRPASRRGDSRETRTREPSPTAPREDLQRPCTFTVDAWSRPIRRRRLRPSVWWGRLTRLARTRIRRRASTTTSEEGRRFTTIG